VSCEYCEEARIGLSRSSDQGRAAASAGRPHRPWHAIAANEALAAFGVGEAGLDAAKVRARQAEYGANILPEAARPGLAAIYFRQFKSPLIYVLLAAAAVSLALGEMVDAAFIFAVLQINAVVGAVQEWKAEASAGRLRSMVRTQSVVLRDGARREVASEELVPGDIVLLESGTRVPADMRLVSARELSVDESLLTGESLPVEKDADAELAPETIAADRVTMLFAGSSVLQGRARGVVSDIGLSTEVGRIAQALASAPHAQPAIVIRMRRFARAIAFVTLGAVILLALAQIAQGTAIEQIFFFAVALAVSAIPEGLPVAVTVALSIGGARMARRNVIIRMLPAVEGLGSCTMIATDKTGTLTLNRLTLRRLWLPSVGDMEIPDAEMGGEVETAESADALAAIRRLAVSAALCNEAHLDFAADGEAHHIGDTADIALLLFARQLGLAQDTLLAEHPQTGGIPFEPSRRFAASFNHADGEIVAHVKGAAETVLPMCADIDAAAILGEVERFAGDGYRVLAVAAGAITDERLQSLEFLGLVGLIDPPRPEVPEAMRRAAEAGVTVCMVTGDHPSTALSVARDVGLSVGEADIVTGAELREARDNPAAFAALVARGRIFARVEPVQKLTIVEAMQAAGHFVAVTGDGVNDAPALAAGNIGVAMGKSGTDVARGAAGMIIADDNFASIVAGIEEGRVAYDNVRKVVYLLISTGAAEIVLFFLAIIAGLPLPLFAAQLLWLNLVTNGIQDVALAFERGEPGVLRRKPRPPREAIFDRRMIEQVALSGAVIGVVGFFLFRWMLAQGLGEFEARNVLLLLLVLFENVHVFNCRSENRSAFRVPLGANPFLVISVVVAQGVHIGAMYTPGLSDVLGVAPVTLGEWATVAAMALVLVVVMEGYKLIRRPPPPPNSYRHGSESR
jgi:Ca2+-transporting ATPase